jgi:hypothetical protein
MTWSEICDRLRAGGVENPSWDAELLLEHFCAVSRAAILAAPDTDYPSPALAADAPFDAILSNPPYIPTKDIATLSPEVHKEPFVALDGGADGLIFYRAILEHYSPLLKEDGFFLFEIGFDQADALAALGKAHNFANVRVICDLGGRDRVVYISNIPFDERSSIL